MSGTHTVRITLELAAGTDPIRGRIEHADGSLQPFWGWLELSEELRRVAADEPERSSDRTPASTAGSAETDARSKPLQSHTPIKEQP
jgi:hypothetical protein